MKFVQNYFHKTLDFWLDLWYTIYVERGWAEPTAYTMGTAEATTESRIGKGAVKPKKPLLHACVSCTTGLVGRQQSGETDFKTRTRGNGTIRLNPDQIG